MSVWSRVKKWIGSGASPPPSPNAPLAEPAPVRAPIHPGRTSIGTMPAVPGAAGMLERATLAEGKDMPESEVLLAIESLQREGREALALRLGRRALALRERAHKLASRLAHIAIDRDEHDVAYEILAERVRDSEADLPLLMLWGDVLTRRGDTREALLAYERVLARSIDYPGAKERIAALGAARGSASRVDATLLADGALARGRYRIEQEVGRGGAGSVYLATDIRTERNVALKVYHGRGPIERERLLAEARIAVALRSPSVVRVFDVDDSAMTIAMEWLESGSLKARLDDEEFSVDDALHIARGLVGAVRHVHKEGYVHRDIKPSNVLLRGKDEIVLTDFGLARRFGDATPGGVGAQEGTLAYMAPEQRAGAAADPCADVHALGATIREVFARARGKVPESVLAVSIACLRSAPETRPTLDELDAALR